MKWLVLVTVSLVLTGIACAQPSSARATVQRAVAAMNAKKYAEAERMLRSVVKRYPTYAEARYELALALAAQEKYAEAIAECEHLCDTTRTRKQSDHYYQLLAELYDVSGDSAKVEDVLRRGLERFPNSARLLVERARRASRRFDLVSATADVEAAIASDPTYPLAYYWAARFYRNSNQRLWAIFYAEAFLNLRPNTALADEMSLIWYNVFREAVEEFDETGTITFRGDTNLLRLEVLYDADTVFLRSYAEVLTEAARTLRFFRDFELPLASLDTLVTEFVTRWYQRGYHERFPNVIIERYRKLADEGLLGAYVHVVAQYGKPQEFAAYAKRNKKLLAKLERWIARNRLVITRETPLGRAAYRTTQRPG